MNRPGQYYFNVPVDTIIRASEAPDGCCAECKHFFPSGLDHKALEMEFTEFSVYGHCRRYPPTGTSDTQFPYTHAHSYCGEVEVLRRDKLPFVIEKR